MLQLQPGPDDSPSTRDRRMEPDLFKVFSATGFRPKYWRHSWGCPFVVNLPAACLQLSSSIHDIYRDAKLVP